MPYALAALHALAKCTKTHHKTKTLFNWNSTDKNEIEGEEGVNEYKGIFFSFAFEVYSFMDKQLIAYGN